MFERLGIDYCCGGKVPLRRACERRELDLDAVLNTLDTCEPGGEADETVDWSKASMSALCSLGRWRLKRRCGCLES